MHANKVKNLFFRKKFYQLEFKKIINKFLFINFLSNSFFFSNKKINFLVYLLNLEKNNSNHFSKLLIKNKCVLTGRNKGVNKHFLISRIKLRNLIKFGIIPGYKKSVW